MECGGKASGDGDGEFSKRLSPRLDSHTPLMHPCSVSSAQRRCSPRLQGLLTPTGLLPPQLIQSPAINSPSPTPVLFAQDTSFQRRISPRLHDRVSHTNPTQDSRPLLGISPEHHLYSAPQFQTILSPRLHQNPVLESASRDSVIQRRLSPRLHSPQHKDKRQCTEVNVDNQATAKRQKLASNGGVPHQVALGVEVRQNKTRSHARVKETLRIFNTYYLQNVKELEESRKQNEILKAENKALRSKVKGGKKASPQSDVEAVTKVNGGEKISTRPDLKAVTKMKDNNEILYPEKRIGHIPGIDIGYQFYSRAEMVAIGFHSHWLHGIDYIGATKGIKDKSLQYTFPIAVVVVLSGQYEDDLDNAENIIYTGQGGHDLVGNKLQYRDQTLVRGNLALKNSMEQSVPIRVVRGHTNAGSYSGKIYSYDGLYKVVKSWSDIGFRGHTIFKYQLQRLQEQPNLTIDQVQFVRGCPPKSYSELPGLVCRDITNGQEDICIPVTNIYDDSPVGPEGFTYIKSMEVTEKVKLPLSATGCACKGNCTNSKTCACAKLNGSDFPYVHHRGGRLAVPKDVVFECGPNCGCGPECLNRTSQKGIRYHLEVFRTRDKGWAVRTRDYIPSGAPVCEYIGVLSRSDELDGVDENDYLFEIDCLHTMNEIEGRERRFGNVPVSATNVLPNIDKRTLDGTPEFCIDSGSRGNVARFINHSCEPNLFVQCISSSHHDLRLARVVLFASDNISPMEELTYDYGYALDSVIDPDGKIKVLPCFCGTAECRKRLY